MAVAKSKPTSAGRRHQVRVVDRELHSGAPYAPLLEKQSRNGGRNNNGRITTRHVGGGHKQHYRLVDFKRNKDGIPAALSVSSTIPTARRTLPWCCSPTASVATSSRRRA
jgi:large subunit ribosomal protein L2